MISVLVIVCTVLAVISAATLALVFSLIGRVRTLQQAVEAGGGKSEDALPRPGERIGPFEAITVQGETLTQQSLATETTLVGFFTPNCIPCERVEALLLESPPGWPMIAFVDGDPADDETRKVGALLARVARVAYASSTDAVTRTFRASGYPTLLRIENGTVAAAGHRLSDVLS